MTDAEKKLLSALKQIMCTPTEGMTGKAAGRLEAVVACARAAVRRYEADVAIAKMKSDAEERD